MKSKFFFTPSVFECVRAVKSSKIQSCFTNQLYYALMGIGAYIIF